MIELNFTNSSFVLYQILPDYKKVDFLDKSMEVDADINKLAMETYQSHFKEVISPIGNTEIGIISYVTMDGTKVNVFFHNDVIHMNSERLVPIKDLVKVSLYEGNILIRDNTYKKTSENRDRYHMRYYRAYRRINDSGYKIPLCLS